MLKVKGKEEILNVERKKRVIYKETPLRLSADFSGGTAGQRGVALYIQSVRRKKLPTKDTLLGKVDLQN